MSSLTQADKMYLESVLDMSDGWVLGLGHEKLGSLFSQHNIDINSDKYKTTGSSQAKKMRSFWDQEPDPIVGRVLSDLLDTYEADCELNSREIDLKNLDRARGIADRLVGKKKAAKEAPTEAGFLDKEFEIPSVGKLPVDPQVVPVIETRLKEARLALKAGANLSVILLCGSVLEAVLLGAAQKTPAKFNQSKSSPTTASGDVKKFHEWNLAQFIDVACDIGLLKPDVKKFSHGLRDFRNYIHPYQQLASGFTPDQHTAKVCFQVLKAALADAAGER